MPTAKALKREASSSKPWWRTFAKWRNLTRRTSSDQPQPRIGFVHEFRALAAAEAQTFLRRAGCRRSHHPSHGRQLPPNYTLADTDGTNVQDQSAQASPPCSGRDRRREPGHRSGLKVENLLSRVK